MGVVRRVEAGNEAAIEAVEMIAVKVPMLKN
jgi:urocanate hydratase